MAATSRKVEHLSHTERRDAFRRVERSPLAQYAASGQRRRFNRLPEIKAR